jgi:drug/metabolite transporter (DMT)-like permease
MFAMSAVGFRGAILELDAGSFVLGATSTLALSLLMQTLLLSAWLVWRDRQALIGILRLWKTSLLAGAIGAFGSQMWFLAFALQSAAAVRTVGLVEILFAQIVSQRLLAQGTSRREAAGMAMMIAGVAWLLVSS